MPQTALPDALKSIFHIVYRYASVRPFGPSVCLSVAVCFWCWRKSNQMNLDQHFGQSETVIKCALAGCLAGGSGRVRCNLHAGGGHSDDDQREGEREKCEPSTTSIRHEIP